MAKKKYKKITEKITCNACDRIILKSNLKRHLDGKTHINNANKKNLDPHSCYHSITNSISTVIQKKTLIKESNQGKLTSSANISTRLSNLEIRIEKLEKLINNILPKQRNRIRFSKSWIIKVINKLNGLSNQKYLTFFQLRSLISQDYIYDENEFNKILQELIEQKIITLSKGSKTNNLDKGFVDNYGNIYWYFKYNY